ncbi:MAG: Yip1 family protein [bacterium]|nr:Yip1 family protein [bacterium]
MENQNSVEPVEVQPAESGLSYKGLHQVFTSPTEFFTKLKDNPKVLVPLLAISALMFLFLFFTVDLIVKMQMESPELQERLQGQPIPPQLATWMRYQTLIGGSLVESMIVLLAAAFALFFGNFVFAGKAKYKQLLSVMCYGEMIVVLGNLLVMPMMLMKNTLMVSLSLAVLAASQGPTSALYVALSKIDLFLIWEIMVIGIGLSIIYNLPRNKGYLLSVLSMGMLSILHVVFTAVGGLF